MGCFLRHNFEEELKSSSQQRETQRKLRPRMCHCRPTEMSGNVPGALAGRARRIRNAS
jgi:hypothetical protein